MSKGDEVSRAAALHAQANPSDPFAANRVVLHMKRHLELPSDVLLEATRVLESRRGQADYLLVGNPRTAE